MDTPSPPPPQPLDPLTVQAEQQAQNQLVAGLQSQARGDMGSLMAAYGKLALNLGLPTGGAALTMPAGALSPSAIAGVVASKGLA